MKISKNLFKEKVFEKIMLIMLVSIVFISISLFSVSSVLGQVNIDTIDIPSSLEENNELNVYFEASTDTNNTINYKIYHNGLLVSNENNYLKFMNYSSSGVHNITFFASDELTNVSEEQLVEVINIPLVVSILNPTNVVYIDRTLLINVSTSVDSEYCSYSLYLVNDSTNLVQQNISIGNLTGYGTIFYSALALSSDGKYLLDIFCRNDFDVDTSSVYFNVDTLNPVILSKSYAFNNHDKVTFNFLTNVACTCKYDLQDNSYELMTNSFSVTGGTNHLTTLINVANGAYTYYIRCKNNNGIVSDSSILSFNIFTKPYASIVLSDSSPIKAGTYKVQLKTTKPLSVSPTLSYNFNTDSTLRQVTLTGSSTDWSGYMIIDENTPNRVGTFHYSGLDTDGNTGDVITDGELFLVDTTPPSAPVSIDARTQFNGDIKIMWYYDDETASEYNIYRSLNGNPDYVDYYVTSSSNSYIDRDVANGVTYYYRVAAIDAAGNVGVLSNIAYDTSTNSDVYEEEMNLEESPIISRTIDSVQVAKINQLLSEFNKYILEIDSAKSELSKIDDPDKLKIIAILGLSEKANSAKTTIDSLIENLNSMKSQYFSSSELDVNLNRIKMDALKAKSLVVEDLIVNEQSSFNQITQESDVDLAISELVTVNLSRLILKNYSTTNKILQDNIVVTTDVFIFKIRYLGKEDYDKFTLVRKVISSPNELNDVSIVEIIPKSFERKASDILFDIDGQKKPVIVNDDPVLRWDSEVFNKQTIYYMINNHAEMYSAKETKTVVLYSPNFKVTDTIQEDSSTNTRNKLTGFMINAVPTTSGSFSFVHWVVLIGVGLILGLSTYYFSLDSIEKKRNNKRLKDHRIISKITSQTASQLKRNPSNLYSTKPDGIAIKKSLASTIFSKFSVKRLLNKKSIKLSGVSNSNIDSSDKTSDYIYAISNKKNNTQATFDDDNKTSVNKTISNNISNDVLAAHVNYNINLKLIEANVRINNFDYENARKTYNFCLNSYNLNSYSNINKAELKIMLDHLYLKLLVYRVIFLSRKHILTRDYTSLKEDIALINKISIKLYSVIPYIDEDYKDAELKFIDYITNSKKHLESKLS